MKKKVEDLSINELNYYVSWGEGHLTGLSRRIRSVKDYVHDWRLAGPLIEANHYEVEFHFGRWLCETEGGAGHGCLGETLLEAIARCYVADHFSAEVEVDDV